MGNGKRVFRRRATLIVLLALVAAAAGGGLRQSDAATSTKYYSTSLVPSSIAAGASISTTLTLTNSNTPPNVSSQTLGSENVKIPSGYKVLPLTQQVSAPNGPWTVSVDVAAGYIKLRANSSQAALVPGTSVSVQLTITAPCAAGTATWTTEAKQSNNFNGTPGNDFVPVGPAPSTTISGTCALAFVQQPTTTTPGAPITPAITVETLDGSGVLIPTDGVSIALAIANDPNGAGVSRLGGSTPQATSGGTATFADITIDRSGLGFTLSASASGYASATSASFNVFDGFCPTGSTTCQSGNSDNTTNVRLDFPSQTMTDGGILFSAKVKFTCASTTAYPVGSVARIVPPGVDQSQYSYLNPFTATLTISKSVAPGTGVANFVLCSSEDGVSYTVVNDCPKTLSASTVFPCTIKRSRNGVGDLVFVMLLTSNDPFTGVH